MEKRRYIFEAVAYPSDDQYEVYVPLLDAYTCGINQAEALYRAQDLVDTLVSSMVEDGEEVPQQPIAERGLGPDGGLRVMLFTYGDVPEEPDMTVRDAADMLGVTPSRVYALCAAGGLASHKVGNTIMVSARSVRDAFDAEVRSGRPRKESTCA